MATEEFDLARWYANRHYRTDPAIQAIVYLSANAPEREIRLLEVNDSIAVQEGPLEPIDFGVDIGGAEGHTLMVLDVTPAQWRKIEKNQLQLPPGWSMEGAVPFTRREK